MFQPVAQEICRRLSFPFFADIEALVPLLHSSHPARPIEQASIYASNALYIFGDLNYRLAMPGSEVKRLIAEEGWSALWSVDQVRALAAHDLSWLTFCTATRATEEEKGSSRLQGGRAQFCADIQGAHSAFLAVSSAL